MNHPHTGGWANGEVYQAAENFNLPIKIGLEELPGEEIKLTDKQTIPLNVAKKQIVTLELEF